MEHKEQSRLDSDLLADALDIASEHDKLKAVNAELLEALKELYTNLFTDGFVTLEHMEKALAAIAKAEGLE